MSVEFEISDSFPVSPQVVYDTWLNSEGHTAMTGSPASVSAEIGGEFTAGDGYITGKNRQLVPGSLIHQAWRTQEFDDSDVDSELVIILVPDGIGTLLTLKQSNLPDHGMQYKQGWLDHYFEPMKAYFRSISRTSDSL
ncbi:MAG: SRPBCC domain-containing protein [Chloroflexi bacterium]|nr:SRPBCC domain-containing protein [Chloroflexota bacterium]